MGFKLKIVDEGSITNSCISTAQYLAHGLARASTFVKTLAACHSELQNSKQLIKAHLPP